jgi:hypothetical protein
MLISRSVGKRARYTVRLTETELVADPNNSELSVQKTSTVYLVADIGVLGTGTYFGAMSHVLSSFLYKGTGEGTRLDEVIVGNT